MNCRVHVADGISYLIYTCAGCGSGHSVPFYRPEGSPGPTWTWNKNVEVPTLSPSARHTWGTKEKPVTCHYTLVDGVQNFHGDDSAVPNQRLPLPELEH